MSRPILIRITIAFASFFLLLIIFRVFQNPQIYNATLGKISSNYSHIGGLNQYEIRSVKKPFEKITPANSYRWDALLFKSVKDSSYAGSSVHYKERLDYYPLYPLLLKITGIDSPLVFLLSYILFIAGLILLSNLLGGKDSSAYFMFTIALLFPPVVSFYLPYAESLFLFAFAVSLWGMLHKKYGVFFIGAFAFAMTRPSVLIYFIALLVADLRAFIVHRNFPLFIRGLALKLAPFLSGFLTVTLIQYTYSGSFTAYFDAQVFWPAESGFFNTINDWSIEGFGMNSFAIFFLALPAAVYCIRWIIKAFRETPQHLQPSFIKADPAVLKDYIFNTALLFIAGNLLYTFLTSGNSLNGFSRYSMAVPFFYIVLFMLPEKMATLSLQKKTIAFLTSLAGLILFYSLVVYGGNRFRFSYTGLYLSIALLVFVLYEPYIPAKRKMIFCLLMALPCLIWHAYLFNVYLSDGWIFT